MNKNITFQAIKFWAKIPHGIWLREATSVAVDSKDNVYVYNRGNIPLLIFNSSGDLISTWGNEDPLGNIKILEGSNLQIWEESKFDTPICLINPLSLYFKISLNVSSIFQLSFQECI